MDPKHRAGPLQAGNHWGGGRILHLGRQRSAQLDRLDSQPLLCEHISTNTAVRIRSHAQEFFTKVSRESWGSSGGRAVHAPGPARWRWMRRGSRGRIWSRSRRPCRPSVSRRSRAGCRCVGARGNDGWISRWGTRERARRESTLAELSDQWARLDVGEDTGHVQADPNWTQMSAKMGRERTIYPFGSFRWVAFFAF
jgi:hypothetical protein